MSSSNNNKTNNSNTPPRSRRSLGLRRGNTPRGRGGARGTGKNRVRTPGLGRGGNRRGAGGVNTCVCPKCGYSQAHRRGTPCSQVKCPKCDTPLRGDFCR
jgi:hypothetical protein